MTALAILEIEQHQIYQSKSRKVLVRVTGFSKHGMDCSIAMVHYTNLVPTEDYPADTSWVMDESMFLRRFENVIMYPVGLCSLNSQKNSV